MGTTIKIKCIDQTLTYEGTPTIASGGVNEDYVEFEFNTLWDGFSKVAVFYQNKGEIYYSLVSTDNTAVIPKEVIAKKGIMYLGVFGVKGNVTLTSQVLQYRIENGALDGFTPVEPTPEIYQQILTELQTIRDLSAETLSNEQAFEKAITKQQTDYESKITNQQTDYETKITNQQNDYETKINSEFDEYKAKVPTIASDKATEVVNAKMGEYVAKTDIIDNLTSTNTDKPLSANQGKVLDDNKQAKLTSGSNIKTVNSTSLLGSGNINLDDRYYTETEINTKLNAKADASSTLQFKGYFEGDFNSTSIAVGIYNTGNVTSTCTNYPYCDWMSSSWACFIQLSNYKTQIIITANGIMHRNRTGNPEVWNSWHYEITKDSVINDLTSSYTDRPLSAKQGKVLNDTKSTVKFVSVNIANKTFSANARASVSQSFTVPSGTLIGAMQVSFNGAVGLCANSVTVSNSTVTVYVNNLDNSQKTASIVVTLVYLS